MKDPRDMSGRNAQEALRRVHARAEVPADAPLDVHPDTKVPGANYVDGLRDSRYWVGLLGEVVRTGAGDPVRRASPEFQAAHTRYTSAVEQVRRHYRTPTVRELFAVPDPFCPPASFVYDTAEPQTVRWVDPDGDVHDGYVLVDGEPRWDEATVARREQALARHAGDGQRAGSDLGPMR